MKKLPAIGLLATALVGAGATLYGMNAHLSRDGNEQASGSESSEPERETRPPELETVHVLVATEKLPVGSALEKGMVRWRAWPKKGAPDSSEFWVEDSDRKSELNEVAAETFGMRTRSTVPKGAPLNRDALFERENAGFMAGLVREGMRAVTLQVSPETSANGFILPGDSVDVIVSKEIRGGGQQQEASYEPSLVAETVLKAVRVVAIDRKTEVEGDSAEDKPKTMTLEVTPWQAERVHVAKQVGELGVSLRPAGERAENQPEEPARKFTTDRDLLDDYADFVEGANAPAETAADLRRDTTGADGPEAGGSRSVTIYRSGQATEYESEKGDD